MNKGSSLYLELSENELSSIISNALHTQISSARLLTGGLFNTTYLIDTPELGQLVLRAGPVNRHLLLPFEHQLMEAEAQVYALLAKHCVPASEILAYDTSKAIIDRDFMLVRYIPSRPMSEAALNSRDNYRICRDIGCAAAKMHNITSPLFGRIADVKSGKGFLRWSECLFHELKSWEASAQTTPLFSGAEYARIENIFKKAVPCLDEIQTPCLVHTDLWKGNILISTDSDTPEFAAIIDADRAIWGDPELDFSSIYWTHDEPAFWEGYGRPLSQSRHSRIRRAVYTMLWYLLDSYVYLREYNDTENSYKRRAMALEQMDLLDILIKGDD